MLQEKSLGKVWIVGAGPGDPDLLTRKASRVIASADLILFDHLVSPAIRKEFPVHVPAFYVGKKKGRHSIDQSSLNALLVKKAREGLQVVRLKGGDPFVFGRGGEEMLSLVRAGVDTEVVPGITSASGAATYAGIPLTHRGVAQGCTLVTGHAESELGINWASLAGLQHTLVFYMALTSAQLIQQNLLAQGMSPDVPVAFIENGCRPDQRVVRSCLGEMICDRDRHRVAAPALVVVGEVVALADQLTIEKALQHQETLQCQETSEDLRLSA